MRWITRNLWLVSITSLLNDISSEMVYPLLPIYLVSVLGASKGMVGLIEGLAEATGQVLRMFTGVWSDRTGRRKGFTISGYGGSAVGKVLLCVASAPVVVLIARFIDKLGKSIRTAPRDALIAESVEESHRGRAFGLHRTADTLGAMVGVAIAYFVMRSLMHAGEVDVAGKALVEAASGGQDVSLGVAIRTVMWWSLVPAVLGILCLCLIREPKPVLSAASGANAKPKPRPSVAAMLASFKALDPRLKGYLLVAALFTLGNSSNFFLILRAQDLGFSAADVILLYLLYNATYMLFSYPAGLLSDAIGRRGVLVTGYAISGLVYLGFALVTHMDAGSTKVAIWVLFGAYGFYTALTEGVEKALLADLAPKDRKATILGLNSMLVGVALLPASVIAGVLWDWVSPAAPFVLSGVTGLAAAALCAVVLRGAQSKQA